jgi:uncharacterized membrane protein (UPF0127 family)
MQTVKVKQAKTIWEQTKGLLGTSQPYPLLLKTRWGIHTFGMKYPIDVIILDDQNKIKKLKEHLQPNQLFLWNPVYQHVLELPSGFIQVNKLSQGIELDLQVE